MLLPIPLYLALIGCAMSGLAGCAVAMLIGSRLRFAATVALRTSAVAADDGQAKTTQIDLVASSLYELTAHVGTQVGQHTQRVSEINNSIESPSENSLIVLAAGKLLLNANQQLQMELEEAKQEINRQRDLMSSCLQESLTDPLTNLSNRRAYDREIARVMNQRRRTKMALSLLIIDIDHFKRVNDCYGHMVGDQLLKSFASLLTRTFQEVDFVARLGGEEFVVVLPCVHLEDACKAAERIRKVVSECRHRIGEMDLTITISVGVKEIEDCETDTELFQKADSALYAAKLAGRNCCFYHDGTSRQRYIAEEAESPASPDLLNVPVTENDLSICAV